MWIFTYGMLCWRSDFEYYEKKIAYIEKYARKLWQGNAYHRGNKFHQGRVFTVVPEVNSKVFGVAYNIDKNILEKLNKGELPFGYELTSVYVPTISNIAFMYIAYPDNLFWKGESSPKEIAEDVLKSNGIMGTNYDYVVNLYKFLVMNNLPLIFDKELYYTCKYLFKNK